jgi:hypothetical protein
MINKLNIHIYKMICLKFKKKDENGKDKYVLVIWQDYMS